MGHTAGIIGSFHDFLIMYTQIRRYHHRTFAKHTRSSINKLEISFNNNHFPLGSFCKTINIQTIPNHGFLQGWASPSTVPWAPFQVEAVKPRQNDGSTTTHYNHQWWMSETPTQHPLKLKVWISRFDRFPHHFFFSDIVVPWSRTRAPWWKPENHEGSEVWCKMTQCVSKCFGSME